MIVEIDERLNNLISKYSEAREVKSYEVVSELRKIKEFMFAQSVNKIGTALDEIKAAKFNKVSSLESIEG